MDVSVIAVSYLQLEVGDDSISLDNQCARFLGAHVAYLLIYWTYWADVKTGDESL